eukprot:m.43045 g.43045  ORF g.43045 m.43045 type:complete len:383 (-) comp9944_c0_seq2:9-1157(-)
MADTPAGDLYVQKLENKGRGLFCKNSIKAGDVVLMEKALASVVVSDTSADPIMHAAQLALAIIQSNKTQEAQGLEPTNKHEFLKHPVYEQRRHELSHGKSWIMKQLNERDSMDESDIEKLILAMTLNAHALRLGGTRGIIQAVFPIHGTMVNHSCRPNLLFRCTGTQDNPTLVLQALCDISKEKELCISYLDSLYLSYPERNDRLMDIYGFPAEKLPTDDGLEAFNEDNTRDKNKTKLLTAKVIQANSAGSDAWDELQAIKRRNDVPEKTKERLSVIAIANYNQIISSGLLSESHTWFFNAAYRVALLLNARKSEKGFASALPLWKTVLKSAEAVFPSDLWPEMAAILQGYLVCTTALQDTDITSEIGGRIERMKLKSKSDS